MRKILRLLPALLLTSNALAVFAEPESDWEKSVEAAESAFLKNDTANIDPNFDKAIQQAADDDSARATIQNQIGIVRLRQRRYADAEKALQSALDLRMQFSGPSDTLTCQTMGNLALAEHKMGNEQKAEELFKKCIEGKRRINPTSASLAISLTNLAHLYADEKRCREARALYSEALGIDSTEFGASNAEVAQDLFNIGALLLQCNNYLEALPYLERAQKAYESLSDEFGKAKSLHYISLCRTGMHQPDKAAEAALAALQTHEHFKGKGDNDTLVHLLNAADATDAKGDALGAEKMYKQALAAAGSATEISNYHLAECNLELGEYYMRHAARDKAEAYFKTALTHYEILTKRERRTLYELPQAYTKLLNDEKRSDDADAIASRYLEVFQPTKSASAAEAAAPVRIPGDPLRIDKGPQPQVIHGQFKPSDAQSSEPNSNGANPEQPKAPDSITDTENTDHPPMNESQNGVNNAP